MSRAIDIIVAESEKTNFEIQATLDAKGITDTGRAKRSIHLEVDKDKGTVTSKGVDYLEALNTGRGPGKFPPPENMQQWAARKIGDKKAAFPVGKKISEEGTEIYKDNTKGIQLNKKLNDLRQRLSQKLPDASRAEVTEFLNDFNKNHLKGGEI